MPNKAKEHSNSYVDEWKSMWEPDLEAIAYNGATCDPTRVDPKVLQWVKETCVHKRPHFIKVLCRGSSLGWHGHGKSSFKLSVPRPFVREHYRELGRVVTLEHGTSHKKWKVSFGAPKKCPSWLQGWRRVAIDNSLKPGDVMIFVLVGHSHLHFHLFDEDGNVMPGTNWKSHNNHIARATTEQPSDTNRTKLRRLFDPDLAIVKTEPGLFQRGVSPELIVRLIPHEPLRGEGFEDDDRVKRKLEFETSGDLTPVEGELPCSAMAAPPTVPLNPLDYFVQSKRRMTTPTERKRARSTAKAYVTSLVGCSGFVVLMSEAEVYTDFHLSLPEQFVLETSFPKGQTKVRLVDWDGGKAWPVYSMMNSRNEISFHRKHWGVFSLEHFLEEGDVCVFQLVKRDSFTISVRVFRVLPLPGRRGRTVWDHYELRPKPPSHISN